LQAAPPVHALHEAAGRDLPHRETLPRQEEGGHEGGGDFARGRARRSEERRGGHDAAGGRGPGARDFRVQGRAGAHPGDGRSGPDLAYAARISAISFDSEISSLNFSLSGSFSVSTSSIRRSRSDVIARTTLANSR